MRITRYLATGAAHSPKLQDILLDARHWINSVREACKEQDVQIQEKWLDAPRIVNKRQK